jgi:excisionase family DNA binding protein
MSSTKKYLTSAEAAEILMVSPVTLRQWAQKGLLPSVATAGGHRRFLPEEIERFARERGISAPAAAGGRPRRILIADDDSTYREILAAAIRRKAPDIELHLAADGFEAGMMTQTAQPDTFLLDLNMPGLNGTDVCRRLRAQPATCAARLVIITGLLTPEVAAEIQDAGADASIEKAVDTGPILDELRL